MKTAISIPDELFTEADALAEELGISRSELYATSLRRYMKERSAKRITEQLNAVYGNSTSGTLEPELVELAKAALRRDEW